jgi:hypothetical protein
LQDHPDFKNDWNKIESVTAGNIKGIRNVIGSGIQLARHEEKARLAAEVEADNVVVVAGESGSGKSAAVAQLVAPGGPFKRTIWLTAEQLSKPSQAELANGFSLGHSIPELITNSGVQGCALVVDGFERFEGEARRRAIELARAVKEEGFVGWKVIVTCQPQSLEPALDALVEAGISDAHRADFEKPKLQEIFEAVKRVPGMRALVLRAELQPILRNLMVLDWVLRGDVAQRFSLSRPWIGETELIDCFWERWAGQDSMKLARDSLLRRLGQREGERLCGVVHIDTIPPDELPLLGELAQEGLIRVNGPSVQFAHDLMGDWARYRILKFAENDAPQRIKTLAHIPRWGRAIRLYAQSLAEHGGGLDNWKVVSAQLAGEDAESKLASDLFLDGLLFAANAESLLEQVWPDLIADKGQILHRLLNRLQHVASFPDWRFRGLIDPRLAEQSEAWFRIPHPLYWVPVLRVLSRQSREIAKHALLQGAEVCALWLRTMPVEMPGRGEAGVIALEFAKEAQGLIAEGLHFGGKDKVIYEAVLLAAPEFPEEVTHIALELGGRRDEPEHAVTRAQEEDRQAKSRAEWRKNHPEESRRERIPVPGVTLYRRGPMRLPAADGPEREVSEGFRSAVLETPALNGLIGVRPEVAREVLLAVCIEEPKHSEPDDSGRLFWRDRLGLADWRHGYPAMYWKGPFLKFLQDAPEQGLDAIVRLVNYATMRWLEDGLGSNVPEEERRKYGLEFVVGGKSVFWLGDANVFAWNRYLQMHGDTVQCALMALEKRHYDEIESDRSIAQCVQYIFDHAESLAFAGVLVSVGLRYPALFTRELQPLLGNFHIYRWQSNLAIGEGNGVWKIALAGQPEAVIKIAADWHQMPHRRSILHVTAPHLMLQDEGTLKYLSDRKAEWAKLVEGRGDKARLDMEFFLARFDPATYTITPHGDGQVLITMRWPAHLEAIAQQSGEESILKMLSMSLALRARRLLDGQDALQPQEVPEFAAQVQCLANWHCPAEDQSQEHYRINSVAGGIAVLIVQYRTWLSERPDLEGSCLDTLQELKPADPEYYSPASITDHCAELFLGEAGVSLLQESSEEWVLRLTFEGVTGSYYSSTLYTMWRAYLLREQLGEKFGELVNLVVLWSALRGAASRKAAYRPDRTLLAKYKETLFRRYAAGKLRGPLIPLRRAETLGRRLVERISRRSMSSEMRRQMRAHRDWVRGRDRKLDREIPDIDLQVLQKGFGFVAGMVRSLVPGEEHL